jgi:PknH-like extracellular domain
MRQLTATVAAVAIGLLVAACSHSHQSRPAPSTSDAASSRHPLAEDALEGLLLSPAEIDAAMGITGMAMQQKGDGMSDDSAKQWPNGWTWPAECLYAFAPAEGPIYLGSGFTAIRGQFDTAPSTKGPHDPGAPSATQAVVLYASSFEANAFFTNSSQSWPACANRQFTSPGDANNPEAVWHVAPVSNTNGTLSTTVTMTMKAPSVSAACQRALTVRNNVVIDTCTCGSNPGDTAVNMASQIAAKVDKQ